MGVIGKVNEEGAIIEEADACAVTGRPVLGQHSVKHPFVGTPYFIRMLTPFKHLMTDQRMAELQAMIEPSPVESTPSVENPPPKQRRSNTPDAPAEEK